MLPLEYEERMKKLLGEEGFLLYKKELEKPSPRALRVNTRKFRGEDVSSLLPFPVTRVKYSKNAFYFTEEKVGALPLHHAGLFYVQEPGAMVPVASLDVKPDWKILDTCASPGGKSLQASSFLSDDGFIISNEINLGRAKVMAGNFERMGERNFAITSAPVGEVARGFEEFFDLVIVDAPCSGEGMFRKESEAIPNWSLSNVKACAIRQGEILESASLAVRGGGYLLYSTCTFSPEENEEVVSQFLEEHPDFSLIPPKEEVLPFTTAGIGSPNFRRFYPHLALGEGQFEALMKRSGDSRLSHTKKSALAKPSVEELKIVSEFLRENLVAFDEKFISKFKDNLVYINPEIPVPEKITYSCGVTLGEVKKGYFKPHHHLFSALGESFKRKINLSSNDKKTLAYLRGESFEYDIENGWCALFVDGVALGGAKVVDSTVKNHYPKGLRLI